MKLPELTVNTLLEEAETNLLDAEELGMLQRLLWQAWRETPACSLPDDDAFLARVARTETSRFREKKSAVLRPFTLAADNRWHHHRYKVLFDRARARAKAYQNNARRRWERDDGGADDESDGNAAAMQRHQNGKATAMQKQCNPLSIVLERGDRGSVKGEGGSMPLHSQCIPVEVVVAIWEGVFDSLLNVHSQEKLAAVKITNAGVWQESLEAWAMNGYSRRNLSGQVDFYLKRQESADRQAAKDRREEANAPPRPVLVTSGPLPDATECKRCRVINGLDECVCGKESERKARAGQAA